MIRQYIEGLDYETFRGDEPGKDAVMRRLEIIGEATKRLSEIFKAAHPDIPWRKMAGMRDMLIHAYDAVDSLEVWKVAMMSLPTLIEALETCSEEL